ncbi:response regulator [Psychroserpens damuponensis]|uniref:response regulator n=1 Tax=Psychroserpens damuponensis TaxID=943936 RepID=UPI000693FC5F|nr:response regulator [Psychroserpens damuponensis]
MSYRFVTLFLFISFVFYGQNQNELDSVKSLIKTSRTFYNKGELDSSFKYAKMSYDLSKALKVDSLQLEIVGILSSLEPDLEKALTYLSEAETIAIKNKNWKRLESIYHTRGAIYYNRTNDGSALVHFLKLDSLLELRNDNIFMAAMAKESIVKILYETRGVNDTSFFPQMNKHIDDGLKLVNKGLKISEDSLKIYNAYYLNVPAAILYEKKAYVYVQRNKPRKAIQNYKKALLNTRFVDTNFTDNQLRKSSIYNGLGNLYIKENQEDSALYYYKKELIAINKTTDTLKQAVANYKIAEFYNHNNDPITALNHLNISKRLMKSAYFVREENRYDIQDIFASVYFNLGDFEKAFKASEKARHHLLEIQTAFNKENVSELETKYQTAKKEQEIALLKSQNVIIEQQKRNQRNLLLGGISIVSIVGLFLFFLYRNHQKTNIKLKELDLLKTSFFANISHEFRTPLTLISSPIDDVLADDTISGDKRQKFTIAKQNSNRLLELVNQLLDLSKIDEGQLKLQLQKGNVIQHISALSESFAYCAKQKNITYTIDISQSNETVWFDKDAIEKITVNLLSNAIKYTPENGLVTCVVYLEKNKLFLKIKNSGKGLTAFELKHIFERFYQTNERNQGSGIGLALVKELVELHKGEIKVSSIPNKETSFNVSLTVDKSKFKNDAIYVNSIDEIQLKTPSFTDISITHEDEDISKEGELPIVLIIEDNNDLRQLLKQIFEDDYNVMSAPNGIIGVQLALEHIPDLIISDIMMPEKDGITLTKDLKNDERTAHIPIILLTAKAAIESQFEGVNIGADDYITKPFNKKLLVLKVEKLIEIRRKLQLRYSQELILLPKDIAVTNLDEKFLEKAQIILDKNLIEPNFNATKFSEEIGMSRMQLHRKLKALTGLTTSEFIRSQRLKLAAQLLKTSDISMSQVCYSVGFNDHSYFTKCFKDVYNCTPTEYANRINT